MNRSIIHHNFSVKPYQGFHLRIKLIVLWVIHWFFISFFASHANVYQRLRYTICIFIISWAIKLHLEKLLNLLLLWLFCNTFPLNNFLTEYIFLQEITTNFVQRMINYTKGKFASFILLAWNLEFSISAQTSCKIICNR